MRPRVRLLLIALCAGSRWATQFSARAAGATPQYDVIDLGTLPECDVTHTEAVNNRGWVVGYAYTHVPPGHGNSMLSRPFLWREGRMIELPTLGGKYGKAFDINDQGDVVGYAEDKKGNSLPVLWRASTRHRPQALGSDWLEVQALLNDGSMAGTVSDGETSHPVILRNGSRLSQGVSENSGIRVNGFNSIGTLAGWVIPPGGEPESFRSAGDRKAAIWSRGREIKLPELGKGLSECADVNEKGVIVGHATTPEGRRACAWIGNKAQVLPSPQGLDTEAGAINSEGVIVGEASHREKDGRSRRFTTMWKRDKFYDLNDLVPAQSGWKLTVANDISDSGTICGYGGFDKFKSHYWRAFVLRPR